jgi:hypothetical protein
MSAATFQKLVTYIKEIQEVALFTTMFNAQWYFAFVAFPLFYIMMPFIGFLLAINAFINAYFLIKANNQNLNQWFNFITSLICAVLSNVSFFGAAVSVLLGITFNIGPWFFFSSLMVASIHQITMLMINFRRVYESLAGSDQRMHYIQAALNNLLMLTLFSAASGAVFFTLFFPTLVPLVGACFAICTVFLMGVNILWRMMPYNWRLGIKRFLNLGKHELNHACKSEENIKSFPDKKEEKNPNHHRFFTRMDYSAKIKNMDVEAAKDYLIQIIFSKIASYKSNEAQKIQDKIAVLNEALDALKFGPKLAKRSLLKEYPLAFQSFWPEKGDVEQIIDAALTIQVNSQHKTCNNSQSAFQSSSLESNFCAV